MQTSPRPIEFSPSRSLSHAAPRVGNGVAPTPFRGLWQRAMTWLAAPRRGATFAELSRMTDRELRDIGLTRGEIRSVYDREFCARRVMRSRAA